MFKKRISILFAVVILVGILSTIPFTMSVHAAISSPASTPKITHSGQVVDSITYRGATINAVYTPYRDGLATDWTYGCFVLPRTFYSTIYGITVSKLDSATSIPKASSGYFQETRSPRKGDIVRCNDYVHWALVKEVNGTTVTIIQQNAYWNNYTCAQVGNTVSSSDNSVSFFTYSGYLPDDGGPIEPTAPNINVCVNAPEVDITWNDVGAYGYYLYVENRDTQNIPYSNDLGRSFSVHLGLSEGHWRVYVMAMYSNNEIKSSSYDFDIRIESPTVSVSVNTPTVDISWNDVGASSYYIYVQNLDTQNIPYSNNIGKNCFIHLGLSNGKWRAYVTAVYSEDLMKSTSVDFTIGDNVIPTVPLTEPLTTPPTEPSTIMLGDVDGDGEVTIIDATCIQRKLASIPTAKYFESAADTDGDGEVTIIDATAIQRHLVQLPAPDRIGKPIK